MTLNIKLPKSHPGGFIKNWILPDEMTITEAAKLLGVSRQSLDALINERRGVSPEMALKLETVFGGKARLMLAMQTSYDLQEAQKELVKITKGLKPHETHPSRTNHHAA
ncbi:MAG TPA: addiction module antidote protein, HigA family [Hellea balneolensis]|uniref:Addiction module antidote protein, HigA family n=1 Tax=Hellea balneolensis TaxID=287478 RepID=A0A7C5R7Y4_9PROT|nr:addiction module antidote protein, HigA family [Hellea balneolensis]